MNLISNHASERITGAQLAKAAIIGVIAGALPFLLGLMFSGGANNPARQSLILIACIAVGIGLAIGATTVRNRAHGLGHLREGDGLEL